MRHSRKLEQTSKEKKKEEEKKNGRMKSFLSVRSVTIRLRYFRYALFFL